MRQPDRRRRRLGVLRDVLERFERAEVDRRLHLLGVPPDPIHVDRRRDRRLPCLRLERGCESLVGEERWIDPPGEVTQVIERILEGSSQAVRHLLDTIGVLRHALEQPELDAQGHELLLRSVVEVPLDLASLLILRLHEPPSRSTKVLQTGLEIGGEPNVPQDESRLRCEVLEERLLRQSERLAGWFLDRKRAEELGPVSNRDDPLRRRERGQLTIDGERNGIGRRGLGGPRRDRPELIPDPEPDVDTHRSRPCGEDLGGPLEHILQVESARHPFGEVRQHLVGRGSLAVHETVREPPRPGAQRLEQQGDRHRRSDRQRRTAPPADERPDPDDHADVHDRDPRREHAIDDGPIDDDVDLIEPVLQDGDRECGRHPDEHDERCHQQQGSRDRRRVAAARREGEEAGQEEEKL